MSPVSSPSFLTRSRTSGESLSESGLVLDVSLGIEHTNFTLKHTTQQKNTNTYNGKTK